MARRRGRRGAGRELCLQSAAFYVKFNIKASLEAVFVAVLDVLPVGPAFHTHLNVVCQVGELHGHQRLQVPRLQELAIVGVVLKGKARVAAHPVVLHCAYFVCILLSLEVGKGRTMTITPTLPFAALAPSSICYFSPRPRPLFGHH